ncbi:palmitoyltransferase [Anaeramoeba flamelloides]|uniref:Palmitoyltransferase n=1 Tax=Anaeramoeba flamelloides TaxID=1746091 RepID=A0ABQ8XW37_9EUKA|nr:palmitoyltransferase [Anaeramoeba flamelloides]
MITLGIGLFILFVLLFGPTPRFQNGRIGKLYRFLTSTFFIKLRNLLVRIFGSGMNSIFNMLGKVFHGERNPLVLIIYLWIIYYETTEWYQGAYKPFEELGVMTNSNLRTVSVMLIVLAVVIICGIFVSPGEITNSNIRHYLKLYPHDKIIYFEEDCPTCNLRKPARSKHCRMLNKCIPKYDHYCGWLMNTIGERNHRIFVLFLVSNLTICLYVCYTMYCIFKFKVDKSKMFKQVFRDSKGNILEVGFFFMISFLRKVVPRIFKQFFVLLFIVFLLLTFLFNNLFLICKNMTTNEATKFKQLKEYLLLQQKSQNTLSIVAHQPENTELTHINNGLNNGNNNNKQNETETDLENAKLNSKINPYAKHHDQISQLDPKNLKNTYNKGIFLNIKQFLFPPSIHPNREFQDI